MIIPMVKGTTFSSLFFFFFFFNFFFFILISFELDEVVCRDSTRRAKSLVNPDTWEALASLFVDRMEFF
jgi:hypothetical protein